MSTTQCYGIDGAPYLDSRYVPCNQTATLNGKYTACCAPTDVCLTNGLCQEAGGNKAGVNLFWRNGCTDPTWQDPACALHCEGEGNPQSHAVHYCLKANSYCCPTGGLLNANTPINTTCCSIPKDEFTAPDPVVYTTAHLSITISTISTASTSSLKTSTRSSSITTSSSSSSTSPPSSSQPSTSAPSSKIGIYAGVPLGIALLFALGLIAWFLRRRKNAAKNGTSIHNMPELHHEEQTKRAYHAEAGVGSRPSELPGGQAPMAELPGTRY